MWRKKPKKSLEWLKYNNFYESTGFYKKNIYFGRERKAKKEIAKALNLRILIKDRYSALKHLL